MSIIQGNSKTSAAGYTIAQSARFNDNDSSYLSKTFASGSTVTQYTISVWVKLGNYASLLGGNEPTLFEVGGGYEILRFDGTSRANPDAIAFEAINNCVVYTAAKHRDVAAWYHIVAVLDSPNATQTDRIRIYVNGERQSVSLQSGKSWPTQNQTTARAGGAYSYGVGANNSGSASTFFDGYMAEYYCLFGQALDPTDFGETDATTGQWIPKAFAGSFSNSNDFYFDFSNSSSFGEDQSGNGNNFTSSGLTSTDQMSDSPTNNFATFNPLQYSAITFANGNLDVTCPTATNTHTAMSTFAASSGKWGCQITPTSTFGMVGVCLTTVAANTTPRSSAGAYGVDHGGDVYKNGSFSSNIGATFTANDDLELLFDADAGTLTVKKNGSAFCTITSIPAGNYNFFWADVATSQASTATGDFGQLSYTPSDAAYKTFCTNNLPDPTIALPSDHFTTLLYAGSSSVQSVTGVGFSPDILWIKNRSAAQSHTLFDKVRGAGATLYPNLTNPEDVNTTKMQSFDSDGFTLGGGYAEVNTSGNNFVSWNWYTGGGTGSSNTDGSITSTVSANTTFSIVTYTGSGVANDTVGHGLGAAPAMIMCFCRDSTANGIRVFHQDLTAGKSLYLNFNYGETTEGDRIASPTSTTFTVTGTGANKVNGSGGNYLAYCFAEVEGFSKFGKYIGNGSSDGTFVYCGFEPSMIICKKSSASGNDWVIFDNQRDTYNVGNHQLKPNTSDAEFSGGTAHQWDFVSNGFKFRSTGSDINTSGATYIFAAFAESPFKTANAR